MCDKTYLLGSSEAMKYEPRLDEEYYVEYGGYKLYYTRTVLDDMDESIAKLKVNMQELEDSYLEDSISEQYYDNNH